MPVEQPRRPRRQRHVQRDLPEGILNALSRKPPAPPWSVTEPQGRRSDHAQERQRLPHSLSPTVAPLQTELFKSASVHSSCQYEIDTPSTAKKYCVLRVAKSRNTSTRPTPKDDGRTYHPQRVFEKKKKRKKAAPPNKRREENSTVFGNSSDIGCFCLDSTVSHCAAQAHPDKWSCPPQMHHTLHVV